MIENETQALTLFELNALVKRSITTCLPDAFWMQAELSDVRSNGGHCYLEFVQKDTRSNNLIAKARGVIWSNVFRLLKPYFEEQTGQPFISGIKVMVKVTVEFHELYGYSLTVRDIDPSYTLGDLANRRREILKQLAEEGVLTLNKELEMPILPQRIAVISSATAAGYGDFCNQLMNNTQGYQFYPKLFPAIMQGEHVEESIIAALNDINKHLEHWDVVVIIRGGGATSDLSGFDTYALAENCAQFPLPILTGIGHERDDTVIDSVAHTRVKTPTAAAEFLIGCLDSTAMQLEEWTTQLVNHTIGRMDKEKMRLQRLTEMIPLQTKMTLQREQYKLNEWSKRMQMLLEARMLKENHRLQLIEKQVQAASPERLLKRGYSITLCRGKAVTDATQVKDGDELTTWLAKGKVISTVKK